MNSTTQFATVRDLAGCRCVVCGAVSLNASNVRDIDGVQENAISCRLCGVEYGVIDGIPYLLVLEERDFLALVEIGGELDSPNYDPARVGALDDTWPRLLATRHNSEDPITFKAALPAGQANHLEDRYEQWSEIETLSGKIDISGKQVLVVGAGLGFDTNLLIHRGARVTAVDLNPQTNAFGLKQTPSARWIGALGRRLPFIDSYFDYVFISASLHHVLDVSATIIEMLRVLKSGGSLFTTNDSFSSDSTTDLEDAKKWNDHQAVLRGINENTPRLKTFVDPILAHRADLDVEFYTSRAYNIWDEGKQQYVNFMTPRRWHLEVDAPLLRAGAGGLFMRITPKRALCEPFEAPGLPIIRPATLKAFIGHKRAAMAKFASLAPPAMLSPPFPGPTGNTKFQVLNGWRWTEPHERGREAFLLGRWFLRRTEKDRSLSVTVRAPFTTTDAERSFTVAVNGTVLAIKLAKRGATVDLVADVSGAPLGVPIAIEIDMSPASTEFDANVFRVERLNFSKWKASVRAALPRWADWIAN